jgi:hypothetical protein
VGTRIQMLKRNLSIVPKVQEEVFVFKEGRKTKKTPFRLWRNKLSLVSSPYGAGESIIAVARPMSPQCIQIKYSGFTVNDI